MVIVASRNPVGFGAKLRTFREAMGYSQGELADIVGVSRMSLVRYETGDTEPSWSVVVKLAETLGVELTDFLDGGPSPAG